jgi:hypothetical protein
MKLRFSLVLVFTILSVSSAWSQKVTVKYDHSANFLNYKTYGWKPPQLLTQQGKENEKLINQTLIDAVNTQLQSKGLTEVQNNPDLYVTYSGGSMVGNSKAGTAYAPYDLRAAPVSGVWTSNTIPGSVPNVWVSMEGILMFEIRDAKTDDVVWSSLLKKKLKNPGQMPKDLDKAAGEIVNKAFKDFPPKAAKK